MKLNPSLIAGILCLAFPLAAFSQAAEKFDFYTRGEYRPNVPRPQSILRYDVGDFHTTYAQMEQVIGAIAAAAPDRVKVFDIGLTNEHRMQHLVAISSPAIGWKSTGGKCTLSPTTEMSARPLRNSKNCVACTME